MNLPNIISLARLLSVPVNVWLIMIGEWRSAFVLFFAAGLSDAVDGYLAKRLNAQTRLGQYLDPIADKALLVSIYITLGAQGQMPAWLVILVVSRDFLIIGGVLLLYALNQAYEPRPLMSSKLNTAMQIALVVVIMAELGFALSGLAWLHEGLIVLTAATTVFSGGAYLFDWGRRMSEMEPPQP